MKKIKLNLILLIALVPLLTFCGGELRDALEGKKRSDQSDEFLVKKKDPLVLPPDYKNIPKPGENTLTKKDDQKIKNILKVEEEETDKKNSSSVEDSILKKIGK